MYIGGGVVGVTPCGLDGLPPCPDGWFCYDGSICLPYCVAAA